MKRAWMEMKDAMEIQLTMDELRRTWAMVASRSRSTDASHSAYLDGMMFALIYQRLPSAEELSVREESTRSEFLEGSEAMHCLLDRSDFPPLRGGRRYRKINPELVHEMVELLQCGNSLQQIGKRMHLSDRTIRYWIRRGREAQSHRNPEEDLYRLLAGKYDEIVRKRSYPQ